MDAKNLTLVSYVCLVAVSCYCFMNHMTTYESEIGSLSFAIIVYCAFMGAWKTYDESKIPDFLSKPHKHAEIFAECFILSLAAAEFWEKKRMRMEMVIFQMMVPFVPVALYISNKDYQKSIDYVILGSLISLITVSVLCGSVLGITAAGIYAAGIFYVKDKTIVEAVPKGDLKNYVDCLFCLFLMYALEAV